MINMHPHHQQEKGLVPVPMPQGEIMWVHPDLMEDQQWTTVTNRKSKGKTKGSSCNVVCASSRETETDILSITDSEEETIVLVVELKQSLVAETRSDQSYLKKYDDMVASSPKPTTEPTKPSAKKPVEKQKELRFFKALPKDNAEGSTTPYHFEVGSTGQYPGQDHPLRAPETIKVNKRSFEGSPS